MRRQVFPQAPSPTITSFFLRAVMLDIESEEWNESSCLCPRTELEFRNKTNMGRNKEIKTYLEAVKKINI